MNRREFIKTSSAALAAGAMLSETLAQNPVDGLLRHRFGVNYVPSKNWYYCYNDWNPSDIARDLDRIAEIGADHINVMVIWPWFQPNPVYVSSAHLDRFDQLMRLAAERKLDVLPAIYTGALSGYHFDLPYLEDKPFYTAPEWRRVQDFYLDEFSKRMSAHPNFMGFNIDEMNCNWTCKVPEGDAWMEHTLKRMRALLPRGIHINGVDHQPWFREDCFSPDALMRLQSIVPLHCYPHWSGASKYGKPFDPPSIRFSAGMAALARSLGKDPSKPIWVQEFGTCSEEMPEADVPRWLEASVSAAIDQGVSWFTWWASHDVERRFEFNPFEYGLGLITSDNRIKEQGRVFSQLAKAYRGKPVKIPTPPPPPPTERNVDATWAWLLDWMGWKPKPSTGQK